MKKLFKVLGIAAAVCMGAGIVLLVFGGIRGGINESLQYLRKHHRMEITESKGSSGMLHHEDIFESETHPETRKHSGSYLPNEVKEETSWNLDLEKEKVYNLDLELLGGNLIIAQGEDSQLVVGGEDGSKLQCYQKGDTIHIDQVSHHKLMGIDKADVVLYLPTDITWREMDIEIAGGTLEADVLCANEVSLDVGAGRGIVEVLEANEGDLSVGAGELVINSGSFRNLDVEVGLGNFEMSGSVEQDLQAEVGVGNIFLELADQENNHNYSLEYGAGKITIGENSYSGIGEQVIRNKGAKGNYEIDCGMGNIEINFIEP